MAELIRLSLAELHRGDRLRPVDADVAAAIAASFEVRGQISPITVRRTPAKGKGATPYTLVAGGHRCAAADICGWSELDALVVAADGAAAQMMEIEENLFRNELNALDRAIFVLKYRELWEQTHGAINPNGGRPAKQGHDAPVFLPAGRELSRAVQEKLGFGPDTYKRATRIGKNLHPTLRAALRGTGAENDQARLLKLAKLSAEDQLQVAAGLRQKPDLKLALSFLKAEPAAVDQQEVIFRKVAALLEKADEATLSRVLQHIGDKRDFGFLKDAA